MTAAVEPTGFAYDRDLVNKALRIVTADKTPQERKDELRRTLNELQTASVLANGKNAARSAHWRHRALCLQHRLRREVG